MLPTSLATPDGELWKRRRLDRRQVTEGQTVELAIDSELEVWKPWSLVGGIKLGLLFCAHCSEEMCEVA